MQNLMRTLKDGVVKKIILDTDVYNEIDDLYALAYAMLSPEKVELLAITAAPYFNSRSTSPADGMEKSYQEALRVRGLVDKHSDIPVYRGAPRYLPSKTEAVESEAVDAIIRLVKESEEPVYIVAIGAITNVASALIKAPEIADKAVVVWLGGHALHWKDNKEFNLYQDVPGAQVLFDSKIPLVQIPCNGVCSAFHTTIPELSYYLEGKNALCDYLLQFTKDYMKPGAKCWSKVIWDVTAVAALVRPDTLDMVEIPRPIITDNANYATDWARPHYLYVRHIKRDALYADLFEKLASAK
ncbi:MAG: nucleoside hydrolase [Ruminococcaceae bacterium]|nr:nucleoside hydrolase [Oscillospiraceae bacterium]